MRTLATLVVGLILLLAPRAAEAAKRVALVVGNSAYRNTATLANPRNDAADMSAALRGLGFTVLDALDADKAAFDRRIRDFANALSGADLAVFFYAGHGLQVGGQNYLAPVDAALSSASALDFETVRLDLVQRTMEREAKASLIFLDACRDNPLSRNLARSMGTRSAAVGNGLASAESGVGTLISFATQPGNVALDGSGRNSPYTAALVRHVGRSSEDLSGVLIAVRNDVMRATQGKQVPWEHSALTERVFLRPGGGGAAGKAASKQASSGQQPIAALPPGAAPPSALPATPPAAPQPLPAAPAAGAPAATYFCGYNSGPKYGRIERFNFAMMVVGGPCHDGRGSAGVAIAEPLRADIQRLGLDPKLWSHTCRYTAGPKSGQNERYPQFGAASVGTFCNDGMGSIGVVVPEG